MECPVGGTVAPVLKGPLPGMAEGTDQAFARVRPILHQICKRAEHMGPAGAGAHMKLAVGLPLAIYWKTLAEGLAMLKDGGIPAEKDISVIADSPGGPTVQENRAQGAIDTLNSADQIGRIDVETLRKDLEFALRPAERLRVSMFVSEAARDADGVAIEAGLGRFDGTGLTRYLSNT